VLQCVAVCCSVLQCAAVCCSVMESVAVGFVRDLTTTKKKNVRKKPIFTNLKKRLEHIKLAAKLLDYFLRSNKSNINQSVCCNV